MVNILIGNYAGLKKSILCQIARSIHFQRCHSGQYFSWKLPWAIKKYYSVPNCHQPNIKEKDCVVHPNKN